MKGSEPRLYDELADWWPLLSAPSDYAEEAALYARVLEEAVEGPLRTLLELGSGGGNNASYLKARFTMTLVDRAPGMLAVSRALNPECEHVEGDMRGVRLGRTFDGVFVHDAISYVTTRDDLRRVFDTAYRHCRPGGAALFTPDHLRETFRPSTSHGGHDATEKGLRYLAWQHDPDPADETCVVDYAFLLRKGDAPVRVEHERHVLGLFSRETWRGLLSAAGFEAWTVRRELSDVPGADEMFAARRPPT